MDADGDFVVVWDSQYQDGSGYGVYGQRYNSSGSTVGSEFQVNAYTTGTQWNTSVAMDADGDFTVVWQSYTQDGSGYGVFGQHFDFNPTVAPGPVFKTLTSDIPVNNTTTDDQKVPVSKINYRYLTATVILGIFLIYSMFLK